MSAAQVCPYTERDAPLSAIVRLSIIAAAFGALKNQGITRQVSKFCDKKKLLITWFDKNHYT